MCLRCGLTIAMPQSQREPRSAPSPTPFHESELESEPESEPSTSAPEPASAPGEQPRRLVLCFDGTGNQYMGTEEDTNIVKIYEMLERHIPGQYAYYQRERRISNLRSIVS